MTSFDQTSSPLILLSSAQVHKITRFTLGLHTMWLKQCHYQTALFVGAFPTQHSANSIFASWLQLQENKWKKKEKEEIFKLILTASMENPTQKLGTSKILAWLQYIFIAACIWQLWLIQAFAEWRRIPHH